MLKQAKLRIMLHYLKYDHISKICLFINRKVIYLNNGIIIEILIFDLSIKTQFKISNSLVHFINLFVFSAVPKIHQRKESN